MPIPALIAGMLPAGIHPATVDEVQDFFGISNDRRMELFGKLERFLDLARTFGLFRVIYLDGSFTTDKAVPGDVDAVLVLSKPDFLRLLGHSRVRELNGEAIKKTYEVHLFVETHTNGLVHYFQGIRAEDAINRNVPPDHRRGILEVRL